MKFAGKICLLMALTLACACGNKRPTAVPRPEAMPRLSIYAPEYRSIDFGDLQLKVNRSAEFDSLSPEWFDIVYPAYRARVNCSLTRSTDLQQVIDNRLERLERNAGGVAAEIVTLTSRSGLGCMLMLTPEAPATPVQFLATDSVNRVFTGVAVFVAPGSNPDSIAPAVKAVSDDMLTMLKQL